MTVLAFRRRTWMDRPVEPHHDDLEHCPHPAPHQTCAVCWRRLCQDCYRPWRALACPDCRQDARRARPQGGAA